LFVCSLFSITQDKKTLKANEMVEVYKYEHQVSAHHVSAQEKKANKVETKINKLTTGLSLSLLSLLRALFSLSCARDVLSLLLLSLSCARCLTLPHSQKSALFLTPYAA